MGQVISRSEAREVAFRIVFSGCSFDDAFEIALDGKKATDPEINFIKKVLNKCQTEKSLIDQKISDKLVDWTIDRLTKTDYAALRIAVAEILLGEVPVPVIINEAVNISKKYGTTESGTFVNGILAKLVG